MINTILDTVFNGLLMGSTGYAMFSLKPKLHPFAYTASAVGFSHACLRICSTFLKEREFIKRAKSMTNSCMELITVPLINMELYRISQQSKSLGLSHGLFIIPLAFDLAYKLFDVESEASESTEVLKELTILGNMVSLFFLAVNENNLPAGLLAMAAFTANYIAAIMESFFEGTGENCSIAGYAIFFALLADELRD